MKRTSLRYSTYARISGLISRRKIVGSTYDSILLASRASSAAAKPWTTSTGRVSLSGSEGRVNRKTTLASSAMPATRMAQRQGLGTRGRRSALGASSSGGSVSGWVSRLRSAVVGSCDIYCFPDEGRKTDDERQHS